MTTLTASLAQSTVVPLANHGMNILRGQYTGAISTSASGVVLLAKIPVTAKDIQVHSYHTGPETTMTLSIGLRHGSSASAAATAFVSSALIGATRVSAVANPTWDDAGGETHKYVQATLSAGTKAASSTMYYTIFYSGG